jgi:uncharacterized Fe-S cluster-containing MiaB family protein
MLNNHPPIIIYEEDKKRYYEALEKYDGTEDIMPMYDFLHEQCEKTWKKTIEKNPPSPKRRFFI